MSHGIMRVRVSRKAEHRAYRFRNRESIAKYKREHRTPPRVIGIDGEGITVNGQHLYTYLAAWDSDECIHTVENPGGLTPVQVFEFLFAVKVSVPHSLLVGFSLGYDYTKWLEGLPTRTVFLLARPEARPGLKRPRAVQWGPYSLNYLRGRLSVARRLPGQHYDWCINSETDSTCQGCRLGESVAVWDVWGFFQGSFIDACQKWGIVTAKEYEYLKAMKLRRPAFTQAEWGEVKDYCGVECQRLARLVTALRDAHTDAAIPLQSYYGAGSTAASLLKRMNVKAHMLPSGAVNEGLRHAVACAFFGGRFEISRFGPIETQCDSYDIASAYPYQLTGLPCLACGKWEHTKRVPHDATFGIVRYRLPDCAAIGRNGDTSTMAWGPFPLRLSDGNIVYPATSGGGWVYLDEFRTGQAHWPNVEAREAWVYHTECDHWPFADIANVYILRLQWGKESRGIVVKLGPNSVYGKLAQSIGKNPPFQCFEWAGAITSNTRAQLLRMIAQAPESIVMTATDGIVSTRPLEPEKPRDTGTREAALAHGKAELGAWECKHIPGGMMLIRPGIAFPLTGELEAEVKARGVGKAVLKSHRAEVLESWRKYGPKGFTVKGSIFHGLKSATSITSKGYQRADNYGQWSERETQVSYYPEPKRPFTLTDDGRLCTWALGRDIVSTPYARHASATAIALADEKTLQREQPDQEEEVEEL